MKNGWEIQQVDFEKLLNWLDQDREAAGLKYEAIRKRMITILSYRGCPIAEELADEAIDRVIKKIDSIAPGYVGDPAHYFVGVVNNVYREFLKKPKAEELPETIGVSDEDTSPEEPEYDCLEKCLDNLPSGHRSLVVEYYQQDKSAKIDNRKKLADSAGLSMGALHVKVFRLRSGLQKCVLKCVEGRKSERF